MSFLLRPCLLKSDKKFLKYSTLGCNSGPAAQKMLFPNKMKTQDKCHHPAIVDAKDASKVHAQINFIRNDNLSGLKGRDVVFVTKDVKLTSSLLMSCGLGVFTDKVSIDYPHEFNYNDDRFKYLIEVLGR